MEIRESAMFFAVITLFPEMFEAITAYGISGRAAKRDLMQIHCINPRDFATGNYKRVDERPFGGGPGMAMMAFSFSISAAMTMSACWVAFSLSARAISASRSLL